MSSHNGPAIWLEHLGVGGRGSIRGQTAQGRQVSLKLGFSKSSSLSRSAQGHKVSSLP